MRAPTLGVPVGKTQALTPPAPTMRERERERDLLYVASDQQAPS